MHNIIRNVMLERIVPRALLCNLITSRNAITIAIIFSKLAIIGLRN